MTQFNYFYAFANQVLANNDPIVGPFLAIDNTINPLTVFDLASNSVTPFNNYWCMIVAPYPTVSLLTHPNLQLVLNRDEQFTQGVSIIVDNLVPPLFIQNLEIVTYYGVAYLNGGLRIPLPPPPPPPPPPITNALTDNFLVPLTDDLGNILTAT